MLVQSPKKPPPKPPRNWVAKHVRKAGKPGAHRDKKHDYQRTPKHRARDFGVSFGFGASGFEVHGMPRVLS